ncbi:hypothetical protein [Streptomyces sp. NPDC087512]|uniref:hypothetical protein n=1 Tax=unclassified Streptomyces TaxID=2593676 RepID=UPI003419D712
MSRRPSHPARLLASALAAGALLTTAACADGGDSSGAASDTAAEEAARAAAQEAPTASPSGSPTGSTSPSGSSSPAALTESGAKAALITEADVEDDWNQVNDAGKWHDQLLVGKVDVAGFLDAKADAGDCQKLLDGLFTDGMLGKPSGASALTGFEQGDSRLMEQVAAYGHAQLDDSMKWLAALPQTCDQFTATGSSGGKRTVQVIETSVPDVGDARQGLEVTVQGTADGAPTTLTLDVAVVRVGDNALTVTGGGPDGGASDSVQRGAQQGTARLKTVLAGGTPSPPSQFD